MANSPTRPKRDKHGRFVKKSALPAFTKAMVGKEFPQINRFIPAKVSFLASHPLWQPLLVLLIASIIVLQLVSLEQTLYSNYYVTQIKQTQKTQLELEVIKWQQIVAAAPNYRDGYFELAILTYRLGRIDETKQYLAKVFALDPNYQPARDFEKTITQGN